MDTTRKIYKKLDKFSDFVERGIKLILVVLVLSCAVDLFLQVSYRFVLIHFVSFSMTWTTEYAQDAIVWITYLTVGMCYKENSMASVDFIYGRLHGKSKLALYLVTRAITMIFLIVGLIYGWQEILSVSTFKSTNLHIPGFALYGFPFLGCILMMYEVITELIGVLSGAIEPFVGRPEPVEEEELTEAEIAILKSMEAGITKKEG